MCIRAAGVQALHFSFSRQGHLLSQQLAMNSEVPAKRPGPGSGGGGGESRRKKRQRYKQYSSTSKRKDLGNGARGFLISCTPKHEVQCFRDAMILLSKHIDVDALTAPAEAGQGTAELDKPTAAEGGTGEAKESAAAVPAADCEEETKEATTAVTAADGEGETKEAAARAASASTGATPAAAVSVPTAAADVADALQAELGDIGSNNSPESNLFVRVDISVNGTIFVKIDNPLINLESVAESILVRARETQAPGCKFCIKIIPVHATCYAKPADAAAAAVRVAKKHFPASAKSYAIQFKSRMNTGAKRDDYIKTIADGIDEAFGKKLAVNLTDPDVVLIVEVMKTSCCVGSFGRFFELGKMNVREAAKPPKEKGEKKGKKVDGEAKEKEAQTGVAKNGTVKQEAVKAMEVGEDAALVDEKIDTVVKDTLQSAKKAVETVPEEVKVAPKDAFVVDTKGGDATKAPTVNIGKVNGDADPKDEGPASTE